ncbi:hypothetical protein LCGC14_2884940 [marine sediment metagenome]|uniref:RNA ligase domain-containing protein n=1 Tax=marine sediment metagenome TaxID=412755 RepID=A0A0F8XYZ6_9ZZZZ
MTEERRINSYPSVFALGHSAIADILDGDVLVEEKVDGSQFSFANFDGELVVRSKRKQMHPDAPESMFEAAVKTATDLFPLLREGVVYRAEYLSKPKHNTLAYDRVPVANLVLFDINPALEEYLSPEEKRAEAESLGLEVVPTFYEGCVESLEHLKVLLETQSFLGGTTVEGVVIKRYDRFTRDKKAMVGKFVSERFKEKHATDWKKSNPTRTDVIQRLIAELRTPARWEKAVQHLAEAGTLEGSPRDIGQLIKEIPEDVLKEEREYITEALFKYAWPQIRRGLTAGMPEWYKERLASQAFAVLD